MPKCLQLVCLFIIIGYSNTQAQTQDSYDVSWSVVSKQVENTLFAKAAKNIIYIPYTTKPKPIMKQY